MARELVTAAGFSVPFFCRFLGFVCVATFSRDVCTLAGSYFGHDDFWVFDPIQKEWTALSGVAAGLGGIPSPRSEFGMASADGLIFLFGGYDGTKPDLGASSFILHSPCDSLLPPHRRETGDNLRLSSCVIAPRPCKRLGAIFPSKDSDSRVATGTFGLISLGDTWSFDPSTARWTVLGNLGASPSARGSGKP